jgi:glycosyltransferase involved in cell wall biosynthesis
VSGLFVGDGDTTDLARRAEAHGITDRIGLLGYREQADRYLSVADVLVLPSRNEGLPIAVLEALRAGVPVVATALPEIAEAVDEGRTGFLVPADDAAALSAAVGRAVTPGVRAGLATACRAVFADRYRLERMTAAYERLYAAPGR